MLSWIEIDAAALRHNYRQFAKLAGRERMAPVLKSNAYGHGLEAVYRALESERPPWICVVYVSEAEALRKLGYQGRILVAGAAVSRELERAAAASAELVVGHDDVLTAWMQSTRKGRIHVKFDTGMSRQGFAPDEATRVASLLKPHREQVVGVATHFANVEDVTEHGYADQQLKSFTKAVKAFRDAGLSVLAHAASSASTLLLDEAHFDLARVGVSLYGVWPSPVTKVSYLQLHKKLIELKPALTWRTEATTVKAVAAGQFIGYGCTFRALHPMRIAVLPVGYFEGFPRLAGNHGSHVLMKGHRCPIVGRICMNMMMVDVTHVPGVKVGDVATLIGTDGDETLSAHEVAAWAQTIHYELLSRIHPDIPRRLTPA